ncbi:hypothetical protein CTI12_AA169570 [Artemisia annua]|uniref:Hybrid signal transduction histidine kinase M n=1 Tax=Artemisia annua TaxID=35608 RepID=A0A2U1PB87_ARTAN|nr:hypothetical protein CTI12_AA169570 [Artemisia annua]
MVNDTTPPPSKYAKLLTTTNFKNLMPVTLDADKLNYSNWSALFLIQLRGCKALEFVQPTASGSSTTTPPPPPTDEWLTVDSIIRSWILSTISESLLERVLKTKPTTAKDIWDTLEKVFKDNKRSKTVELVGELRSLDIGDLTVDAYFRKIDSLASRLDNLGSNITEDDWLTYAINGLSNKYDQVAHVILNKEPFPNLEDVRSMVSLAETRMNRKNSSSSRISTSSPTALVAQSTSSPTFHVGFVFMETNVDMRSSIIITNKSNHQETDHHCLDTSIPQQSTVHGICLTLAFLVIDTLIENKIKGCLVQYLEQRCACSRIWKNHVHHLAKNQAFAHENGKEIWKGGHKISLQKRRSSGRKEFWNS